MPFLKYKYFKLKLRVLLEGHTVSIVISCVTVFTNDFAAP